MVGMDGWMGRPTDRRTDGWKNRKRRVVGVEGEERETYIMNVYDPARNQRQESTMR